MQSVNTSDNWIIWYMIICYILYVFLKCTCWIKPGYKGKSMVTCMLNQYIENVILISPWVVCFKISPITFLHLLGKTLHYQHLPKTLPKNNLYSFAYSRNKKDNSINKWAAQLSRSAWQQELAALTYDTSSYRMKNTPISVSCQLALCGQKTNPGTKYFCSPGPVWNMGDLATDLFLSLLSDAGLGKAAV